MKSLFLIKVARLLCGIFWDVFAAHATHLVLATVTIAEKMVAVLGHRRTRVSKEYQVHFGII